MSMKVIFLKDVGGAGKRDEVKEISDGYALNYLIPRGLTIQATPDKIAALKKRVVANEHSLAEKNAKLAEQIKEADGKKIVVKVKANDQGHLFKSVKKDDVAQTIADTFGTIIDVSNIVDFAPAIKEIGEYAIHLAGADAEATVNFVIEAATS